MRPLVSPLGVCLLLLLERPNYRSCCCEAHLLLFGRLSPLVAVRMAASAAWCCLDGYRRQLLFPWLPAQLVAVWTAVAVGRCSHGCQRSLLLFGRLSPSVAVRMAASAAWYCLDGCRRRSLLSWLPAQPVAVWTVVAVSCCSHGC